MVQDEATLHMSSKENDDPENVDLRTKTSENKNYYDYQLWWDTEGVWWRGFDIKTMML